MNSIFDWIWALLPLFFAAGISFWVYNLQERIEDLERRLEEQAHP